jgi:hypothetical protein
VPGGLAESTGILSVNDEVVEVNGIDVATKTLDQVTDMMIANSSNLIITVKPANQRGLTASPSSNNSDAQSKSYTSPSSLRHTHQRMSQMSASVASTSSYPSNPSYNEDEEDDDMDEIRDLTTGHSLGKVGNMSGSSGTGSDRPPSSSTDPMAFRLERPASQRDSLLRKAKATPGSTHGQHVTKIILDGKSGGGIIRETEQVFTL